MKVKTAAEAVRFIESGHHVFVHTAGATPIILTRAMTDRHQELRDVIIYHMHTEGEAPYAAPGMQESFRLNSFFLGSNVRKATNEGYADYIPSFLSEVPLMIRSGIIPVDVALIQVSPPDKHGYCSLGISVDTTRAAIDVASIIIAQVNHQMPRTHGDGIIHSSRFTACIEVNEPIYELKSHTPTEIEMQIGKYVAGLIPDRATLQTGIGAIPNATLSYLENHKDLGVHTEMFSDGVIPLVKKGVITNKYKKVHPGVMVSGFLLGTRKLYDFVDDNPFVRMLDIQYVNDTKVIRKLNNMISINSAIEVDITGQVQIPLVRVYTRALADKWILFVVHHSLKAGSPS